MYLWTNWHVVTGLNADNGKGLSFTPTHLVAHMKKQVGENRARVLSVPIPLYRGDQPVWLEHPLGRSVDCVALLIPDNDSVFAVNQNNFDGSLVPYVGMDCFIVGYPKGLMSNGMTPLWKRGSIASEPIIDHDGRPLVLVDSATRDGMSGSAVIGRHSGIHDPSGEMGWDSVIGTVQNFVGIYSGRIEIAPEEKDIELASQVGRVWKFSAMQQIIEHASLGPNPHQPV